MLKNLKYADMRLRQWAEWYRSIGLGLGYPPVSLEYRMMKEGVIQPTTGVKPLPVNEEAEEVEMLIKEMAEENVTMAEVLRKYYFSQKIRDGSAIEEGAKALRLSYSRFRYYLDAGRFWVDGALNRLARQHLS